MRYKSRHVHRTGSNCEHHFKEIPQNFVEINEIALPDMHRQTVFSYLLENKPGSANL